MRKTKQLNDVLRKQFHLSTFRQGQKEIITDVLAGKDILGILPTGSGKSLCYQLPAKILPGLTVVVSPLISLMIDQVKHLKMIHYKKVAALNSLVPYQQRLQILQHVNHYDLLYVSPEMLQQEEVFASLAKAFVSLFVIDEAHCISQWGHEFRPDYLRLHKIIKDLGNPPILALSATATEEVQKDIIHSLQRNSMKKHIYPMDRENIILHVKRVVNNEEKRQVLKKLLAKYNFPMLIYFSSRKEAEGVARFLAENIPKRQVTYYHGGLTSEDRVMIQQQFMNDQVDVICCTSAFGMGIDKEDIRLVIHYHFPAQLEDYLQEFGRAGRDGHSSVSLVLYAPTDLHLPQAMIEHEFVPDNKLRVIFQKLYQMGQQKQSLPSDRQELEQLFGIHETQWRSLQYQLEKQAILNGKTIIPDRINWEKAFTILKQHREERLALKRSYLLGMIDWLESDICLRRHLYLKFQSTYEKPKEHCCSQCGFAFQDWDPKQSDHKQLPLYSWKKQLEQLLLGDIS